MKRFEWFLIIPLLIIVLWALAGNAYLAHYNVEDDYHYVKMARPEMKYFGRYEPPGSYTSFGGFYDRYNHRSGRSRPLSLLTAWTIGLLSDAESQKTGLILFFCSAICILMCYRLLRTLQVPWYMATVFVLLFITGRHEQIYYRRSGELFAMICLFAGFIMYASYSRNNNHFQRLISISFFICAALYKESFTLLLPSVFLLLVLFQVSEGRRSLRDALRAVRLEGIILSVAFVWSLAGIMQAVSYESTYSVGSIQPEMLQRTFNNLFHFAGPPWIWLPVFAFLMWSAKERRYRISILLFALAAVAGIASQLAVYYNNWIDYGRYLLPGSMFLFAGSALCLKELASKKILAGGILTVLILFAISGAKNMIINVSYYQARTMSYFRLINEVSALRPDTTQKVCMVVEEGGLFDLGETTAVFLSERKCNPHFGFTEILKNGMAKEFDLQKVIEDARIINRTTEVPLSSAVSGLNDPTVSSLLFTTPRPFCKLSPDLFLNPGEKVETLYEKYLNVSWADIIRGRFNSKDSIGYCYIKRIQNEHPF